LSNGGQSGGGAGGKCFIATAAYGSALAPEVEFLRRFRDDVLCRTRNGREFFDEYWDHYYRVSPLIVDVMNHNPRVRELVRWSVVNPLVEYLRILVEFPDAPLNDVPQPWRSFLLQMRRNMEEWAAHITPPYDFAGLSPSEAVEEIRLVLRYIYRHNRTRRRYLLRLQSLGHLPVNASANEGAHIEANLREDGRTDEEISLILASGEEQARLHV
jgi:hypothetical protein